MAREKTAREMADGWREITNELRGAIQESTATADTYARFEAAKELWIMYENLASVESRCATRGRFRTMQHNSGGSDWR